MAKRRSKSRKAGAVKRRRTTVERARQKRARQSDRATILAEMRSAGLTAKEAAKKYGISVWTVYGWRKTRGGRPTTPAKRGRPVGSRRPRASLAEVLRPVIAELVRDELKRLAAR
jgi:DNA-binding CsgD family transcriptional regulator